MMERARWILLGTAMVLTAVALSWSCGGGGGGPVPCPTFAGGVPVTACAQASPAGPALQAISICPGPPAPPTAVPTSSVSAVPTSVPTCSGQFVTSVPSPQATVQFHAVGTFNDGSTQDITNGASTTWITNNTSVAMPNTSPPGSYFAAGPGCTAINASSGGILGSNPAVVVVQPVPATTTCPSASPTTASIFER
jgi:hypothetical protein